MKPRTVIWAAVSVALTAGCAKPPRPASLAQADQVRGAPAIDDAAAFAPQVIARAESLRKQAEAAYDQGDIAAAATIAEQAVVAYERAAVLARIARAELTAASSEQALDQTLERQRVLDAERNRLEADIASLEQLIRVVRDTSPITPTPPADHSREMARLQAARSVVVDARLLCSAAKLLGKPLDDLAAAETEVARLEELLANWPKPAPIDDSLRARTRCLALLTLARRSGDGSTPADVVLAELSNTQVRPHRDDRGVVVTIRGEIQNPVAKAQVDAVSGSAKSHPQFPILVVAHTRAKPSKATEDVAKARASAVVNALQAAGINKARIETVFAGPHRPVIHDSLPPPSNSQNDRVEVVFVTPSPY